MPPEARILPDDAHNRTLVANVHPPDWVNPTPAGRYDLVVIGAGTGGLVTALLASTLGARTALVERHLMGGDCLNVGCVPSKAVIRASRQVHEARASSGVGMPVPEDARPDFGAVMERMRAARARISHEDSARRYTEEFGLDVFLGEARFTGSGSLDVDGTALRFSRAVIATGARATAPSLPGLAEAGYLTNETVFELTERPKRLAVIGGGPIGCELSQAFQRLGSRVTLFEKGAHVLAREDADASGLVQGALRRDGVDLVLGCELERVERKGDEKVVHVTCADGSRREVVVDEILVGAGRQPNVEDLGLDAVGVDFDPRRGIAVDDHLRTSHARIWAVGDCCMAWKFTHAAEAAAKIAVQNALFALGPIGRKKVSDLVMPWCTYTDPEVAHVGLYPHQARERGIEIDSFEVPMERSNRAVTDGEDLGLVKVHVRKGSDRILGATIVAAHAGELITPLILAIQQKIGLGAFTNVIYPYPTQSDVLKAVAGAYTRTRLTPTAKRVLDLLIRLKRR